MHSDLVYFPLEAGREHRFVMLCIWEGISANTIRKEGNKVIEGLLWSQLPLCAIRAWSHWGITFSVDTLAVLPLPKGQRSRDADTLNLVIHQLGAVLADMLCLPADSEHQGICLKDTLGKNGTYSRSWSWWCFHWDTHTSKLIKEHILIVSRFLYVNFFSTKLFIKVPRISYKN